MQEQTGRISSRTIMTFIFSCSIALLLAACGGGGGGGGTSGPPAVIPNVTTAQEVPAPTLPDPAATNPSGMASFVLYSTNKLRGSMTLTGFNLSGTPQTTAVTAAHIHDGDIGASGGVVVALTPDTGKVVWSLPANTVLTDAQVARFKAGGYYVNAHTATNPAGLIRGQLISFADNIQTIFNTSCAISGCHAAGGLAPMSLAAGASRDSLVNVNSTSSTRSGIRVIPGNSADSILFRRINGTTAGPQMPQALSPLGANSQNLIKIWIETGAVNN